MLINFSSAIFSLASPCRPRGSRSVYATSGNGALEHSVGPATLRGVSQEPFWDVPVHYVPGFGSGRHASGLHHLYYHL